MKIHPIIKSYHLYEYKYVRDRKIPYIFNNERSKFFDLNKTEFDIYRYGILLKIDFKNENT